MSFSNVLLKQLKKKRVFLGGTCNNSRWRDELIPLLDAKKLSWFNPVVEDWKPEDQEIEIKERETADIVLYVITPRLTGVYSIAEVTADAHIRPENTVFCFLLSDSGYTFSAAQIKSLSMVGKMVTGAGAVWLNSLEEVAEYLNG